MTGDYERFNELTFESYCKTSIDHAIAAERKAKAAQAKKEIQMAELTDEALSHLVMSSPPMDDLIQAPVLYECGKYIFPIYDTKLGQVLSYILPKKRNIILLSYGLRLTDKEIAQELGMSQSAVQRQRSAALEKLRKLMGEDV